MSNEQTRSTDGMKLTMRLGERSYDIILKRGALHNLGLLANLNRRVLIVTDSGVPAEYAEIVRAQCREGHIETVPQGEGSKCLKVYEGLLRRIDTVPAEKDQLFRSFLIVSRIYCLHQSKIP